MVRDRALSLLNRVVLNHQGLLLRHFPGRKTIPKRVIAAISLPAAILAQRRENRVLEL